MTNFTGTSGDDLITASNGADTIDISSGGVDQVNALGGDDVIIVGGSLTAADRLDGGAGIDTVVLNGNYAVRTEFSSQTMLNVEKIKLTATFDYNLRVADATVAAGQNLSIDGSTLGTTDKLIFEGSRETNGSFTVFGGLGEDKISAGAKNDTIDAGAGDDKIDLSQGGNDKVSGGDGNDHIVAGAALTAADRIDGGTGNDQLVLNGNYSSGVTFGSATMINVESLRLGAGHSYDLIMSDANVLGSFAVLASELGAGDTLTFSGSAETNGNFVVSAGAGNDHITGGAGNDKFDLSLGGDDFASGGAGDDTFVLGATLNASDHLDGGSGFNTLLLDGDYSSSIVLGSPTAAHIQKVQLTSGHSYSVSVTSLSDSGHLQVQGGSLGAGDTLFFDGSAGDALELHSGAGNDRLIGSSGQDRIIGGNGADTITGGSGNDLFVYGEASESTGLNYDTITDFTSRADKISLPGKLFAGFVSAVNHAVSDATFDFDLAAVAANMGNHQGVLFTVSSGDLVGKEFLIVDLNGLAGYQSGGDLVIHMANGAPVIASDFT